MIGIELVQELATQRCLSASDFPYQDNEALLLLDPVLEVLEGFLVGGTEEKKLGIRRDVEGHLPEPVKLLIHHRVREPKAREAKGTPKATRLQVALSCPAVPLARFCGGSECRLLVLWLGAQEEVQGGYEGICGLLGSITP